MGRVPSSTVVASEAAKEVQALDNFKSEAITTNLDVAPALAAYLRSVSSGISRGSLGSTSAASSIGISRASLGSRSAISLTKASSLQQLTGVSGYGSRGLPMPSM